MALRTGKVILARGIKLDKNYKNIMDYTESQMVTLLTTNAVATLSNCSFLRPGENTIDVELSYGTALQANYLGLQNPDYSNKWFFAFIDEVQYISNSVTRISYTIDECATWFDYWDPKACFVIREHTNNDTIGNNLLPENVELGEYVKNGSSDNFGLYVIRYVINATYGPYSNTVYQGANVGGVPMGGNLFVFDNWQQMVNALQSYANMGHLDSINNVYIVPYNSFADGDLTYDVGGDTDEYAYYIYNGNNRPVSRTKTLSRPASLNGYTPKNNKMLTWPYQGFMVTNNAGTAVNYQYEYFSDPSYVTFTVLESPVVGASIFIYPLNYKNFTNNYTEGLIGPKYPTLSWSGDSYTNWLTQNAVNLSMGVVNDIAKLPIIASNPVAGSLSLAGSIGGQISELYQRSLVPQTIRGNTNGGDVLTGQRINDCYIYKMSIRADAARIIDNYMTMFGYKTAELKIPNQTGRAYWNYVQIGEGENIGYENNTSISVPSDSMEKINSVYQRGVTIWHQHDNLGNYNLNNSIV